MAVRGRRPERLIDQRGQRCKDPLAGADPRWLDMARQMLAEHTQASKPTRDLVLAEVAARLDAEHGDGAVPVPKPTRARAAAGDHQGDVRARRDEGQAGDRRPPGRALRAAAGDAARWRCAGCRPSSRSQWTFTTGASPGCG